MATPSKYRQENVIAATTRTAARQARPTLSGCTSKSIPMTIPRAGRKPANQYTWSRSAVRIMSTNSMTATAAAVPMAARSSARRPRNNGAQALIAAAASSGTTTARASSGSTVTRHPLRDTSSCGSSVPNRLCAWTANDRSSAVTAASTTTSVSASACTTGSTAGVWSGTSKKYGATPPVTYPTPSSSTYVDDCTTIRQMIWCTRWRLVTTPYRPTARIHATTMNGNTDIMNPLS